MKGSGFQAVHQVPVSYTHLNGVTAYFLYADIYLHPERTGRGYYSGFRFRNKNTGNEYSFHPGRSGRESIYEHGQTRG